MAVLRVKNISKSFGGLKAVDNASLVIAPNQITALIGPNGAGKTTLFNVISGILGPDRGIIEFQGRDITHCVAWMRARLGISRTFQFARYFGNLTLRENLVLSLRQNDDLFWKSIFFSQNPKMHDDTLKEKLRFVGLKKSLDEKVLHLSYGEQKLFDIARALLFPHHLLLLDEPVAGVNPVTREQCKNLLRSLKEKGESIFVIEHDMDFVRSVADHVICLHQGSVLTQGMPQEVLSDKKVLEAYLGKS